jgi:hypothetical protein
MIPDPRGRRNWEFLLNGEVGGAVVFSFGGGRVAVSASAQVASFGAKISWRAGSPGNCSSSPLHNIFHPSFLRGDPKNSTWATPRSLYASKILCHR